MQINTHLLDIKMSMERWPSGLRRTLGKRVRVYPLRGFESHPLLHFPACYHVLSPLIIHYTIPLELKGFPVYAYIQRLLIVSPYTHKKGACLGVLSRMYIRDAPK